jgi:hypothetical protein
VTFFKGRARRTESAAQATVVGLAERLGAAGRAAELVVPGVAAEIDQHAAAVRDILAHGVSGSGVTGVVLLAGYADGVLDAATAAGWSLPEQVDWTRADWTTLRLAAVVQLATKGAVDGLPDPGTGLQPI